MLNLSNLDVENPSETQVKFAATPGSHKHAATLHTSRPRSRGPVGIWNPGGLISLQRCRCGPYHTKLLMLNLSKLDVENPSETQVKFAATPGSHKHAATLHTSRPRSRGPVGIWNPGGLISLQRCRLRKGWRGLAPPGIWGFRNNDKKRNKWSFTIESAPSDLKT